MENSLNGKNLKVAMMHVSYELINNFFDYFNYKVPPYNMLSNESGVWKQVDGIEYYYLQTKTQGCYQPLIAILGRILVVVERG